MLTNSLKYQFILNPIAGRGKAYRAIKKIRDILRNRNVKHHITLTDAPNHATHIAIEANNENDVIVAVGGDGTINEVINGMVHKEKTFGILPLGSGNDFAKALRIPNNLDNAIDIILSNKIIKTDVGKVITSSLNDSKYEIKNERYFINGIGVGFDALVAYESSKINFLRGLPLYITSVFKALLKYRAPKFNMIIDNNIFHNRYFLIAIGNGISAGGGFYLTPNAILNDQKFDICYVKNLNIFKILRIFPTVLKGLHGKFKEVQFKQAQEIKINSSEKFYVHADGEIVGNNVNKVDISVIPNALNVITG